jgi:hypothetical protein
MEDRTPGGICQGKPIEDLVPFAAKHVPAFVSRKLDRLRVD